MQMRSTLEARQNSVRTLTNFLPDAHGPVSRRKGFRFLGKVGEAGTIPQHSHILVASGSPRNRYLPNGVTYEEHGTPQQKNELVGAVYGRLSTIGVMAVSTTNARVGYSTDDGDTWSYSTPGFPVTSSSLKGPPHWMNGKWWTADAYFSGQLEDGMQVRTTDEEDFSGSWSVDALASDDDLPEPLDIATDGDQQMMIIGTEGQSVGTDYFQKCWARITTNGGTSWSNEVYSEVSDQYTGGKPFSRVTYAGGKWFGYVAAGLTEGDLWVSDSLTGPFTRIFDLATENFPDDVVYGNGIWVVYARGNTVSNRLWYSTDATNWTKCTNLSSATANFPNEGGIGYSSQLRWILAGDTVVFTSDDGISWTKTDETDLIGLRFPIVGTKFV